LIEYAKKYEQELRSIFYNLNFDLFYKYAFLHPWRDDFELPVSTYDYHSFVSHDKNQIIGFIAYNINRITDSVSRIQIVNFNKKYSYIFGKDAIICMKNVFEVFNFRKINFDIVIGNPIEKTYDKLILRYGGRIVGVKKEDVKLIDGKYYDLKQYEIFREDYFSRIK
jgi:hypothetical protein